MDNEDNFAVAAALWSRFRILRIPAVLISTNESLPLASLVDSGSQCICDVHSVRWEFQISFALHG